MIKQEENESQILNYRLLTPDPHGEEIYLYNDTTVVVDSGKLIG